MQLLISLVVPAAFVYFMAGSPDSGTEKKISYATGIVAGICSVLMHLMLSSLPCHDSPSMVVHLLLLVFTDTLVPFVLFPILLHVLFRRPVLGTLMILRPQLFGIATVFLPYIMLSGYNTSDFWAWMCIPAMLVSLLFFADYLVGRLIAKSARYVDTVGMTWAFTFLLAGFVLADLAKTFWFFCYPWWLYGPLSLAVISVPFALRIMKYRK
jgi:hypothetical protein